MIDPALCLHPRLRQMYEAVHECLECGLRGEMVNWEPPVPLADQALKFCPDCEETKPLSAFFRCAATRDGHQTYCKLCHTDRNRTHRKKGTPAHA